MTYSQTWKNNMTETAVPVISPSKNTDFTKITFAPDLKKFGIKMLSKDMISLMRKRAIDVAATTGCRVYLKDELIPVNDFESYCKLYPHNTFRYAKINKHWEIAISDNTEFEGFEQVSFCNSINTSLG